VPAAYSRPASRDRFGPPALVAPGPAAPPMRLEAVKPWRYGTRNRGDLFDQLAATLNKQR